MRRLFRLLSLIIASWALIVSAAEADERILSYDSDVVIGADATLLVTETIKVRVEGRDIRRGIYRTFPTNYKDDNGYGYRVGFEVIGVERNGSPENYKVENISGGKSVRMGRADHLLEHGVHTYQIRYRTTHQLGFFDGYDELYWNVTGIEWKFPIDQASVTIHLPNNASATGTSGYTGGYGSTGTSYEVSRSESGLVRAHTTKALRAYEGFTFAVSWPEGSVARPTSAEKKARFLRDNASAMFSWAGFVLIFVYYFRSWDTHGRDPEPGTIVPRFHPPTDFSPAACRFVWKMNYDRKAFSAALINMAVKGFITIKDSGKSYEIFKVGTDPSVLSKGERQIATKLVGTTQSIELKQDHYEIIGDAVNAFSDSLEREYEVKYFVKNIKFFLFGLVLSGFCLLFALLLMRLSSPEPFFIGLGLGAWTVVGGFILFRIIKSWIAYRRGLGNSIRNLVIAVVLTLFFIPTVSVEAFAIWTFGLDANMITAAAIFGIFATNITFYFLMKAPTQLGRQIMDEIEGFRLYLSTAEHHRLDALHPPERTPQLFEKFLPYAMALDLETEWTEGFDDVLKAVSQETGQPYQPLWYSGSHWNPHRPAAFASSIGSSVATAVATSASPPGSSSGSGGGGFSGGGGGGGGGGGW